MANHYLGTDKFREHISEFCNKSWLRANADPMQKDKANVVAEIPGALVDYPENIVVKNFGWRNTLSIIFSPVMRSRAKKSWDMAHWLQDHGVATPEPIAVFTRRNYRVITDNFYVSKAIQNYRTARQILRDDALARDEKDTLVQSIARIVQRIHGGKAIHNDLTLQNFLVREYREDHIYLVDLNRATHWWTLPRWKRLAEIARMDLCHCDFTVEQDHHCYRDVFLREYSGSNYETERKILAKQVSHRRRQKRIKKWRRTLSS